MTEADEIVRLRKALRPFADWYLSRRARYQRRGEAALKHFDAMPGELLEDIRKTLERCERVFGFDLHRMVTWGDDYNQAVKDAYDSVRATLDTLDNRRPAAPADAVVATWQPIKTGPKGRPVLVAFQSGETAVCYQTNNGEPFHDTWRYAGPLNRGSQAPWPVLWREITFPTEPERQAAIDLAFGRSLSPETTEAGPAREERP